MRRFALIFLLTACSVDHTGLQGSDASLFCETVNDCFDPRPCASVACVDSTCVSTLCPLGTVCDEASGACEGTSTCLPDECAINGRSAATCSVGRCDGDLCVSEVEAACNEPGMLCCGGSCIACTTDDPCLQPACNPDGSCGTEPRPAGTYCNPGGLFCNGAGTCDGAGACTDLVRCEIEGPEGCDEVADLCVGCRTDAGCFPAITEVDCAAELAANAAAGDPFDCRVTRQREIIEYTCSANVCVPSPVRFESVDCNRDPGDSCGSVSIGSWSSCTSGYSGFCDESARRSRTITTPTCNGSNACANVVTTENDDSFCDRTRDGLMCGMGTTGTWSACTGFSNTCDETGTQMRSTTTFTCGGDVCNTIPGNETRACTRSTNGVMCNATVNGMWSTCVAKASSTVCDTVGTQSRTVTTNNCAAGSCSAVMTTENRDCPLTTDMLTCGDTEFGAWGDCTYASFCSTTGSRSRAVTTHTCSSGACISSSTTETEACSRVTNGMMCEPAVVGPCRPSGDPGSVCGRGTVTTTPRVCQAGVCSDGTPTPSSCNPDNGTTCSDPSLCITDGMCMGSNCNSTSTICPETSCGGPCTEGGETCQCDSGACQCQ